MGCATGCAKMVLIILNIIFFLAGAGIVAAALFVRFSPDIGKYAAAVGINVVADQLFTAAYVLIGFGAFTLLVGFCGCFGAIKENKCMLGIYITLVVLIIGAEIGGGAFVYATQDSIVAELKKEGKKYLKESYGSNNISDKAWDEAMKFFQCCGVDGLSDFTNSSYTSKNPSKAVPDSCCKRDNKGKIADETKCQSDAKRNATDGKVYGKGCEAKLKEALKKYSVVLLGVAGGVAGFEVFVVLMAICTCCGIEKDDY